jgi:acyl dehydratase
MAEHATESLITDEMRAAIGKESEPWTCEVDRIQVRMFARAVGHTAPVFYDEEAAKQAGYRSLLAPPGYLGTPVFDPNKSDATSGRRAQLLPQPRRPLNRRLNGGTEIEYFADICAGDVLKARSRLASVDERTGSIGQMLITTTETIYTNQHGETVAIMRGTGILY